MGWRTAGHSPLSCLLGGCRMYTCKFKRKCGARGGVNSLVWIRALRETRREENGPECLVHIDPTPSEGWRLDWTPFSLVYFFIYALYNCFWKVYLAYTLINMCLLFPHLILLPAFLVNLQYVSTVAKLPEPCKYAVLWCPIRKKNHSSEKKSQIKADVNVSLSLLHLR